MAKKSDIAATTSGSSTPCSARKTIVPDWPPAPEVGEVLVEHLEAVGALRGGDVGRGVVGRPDRAGGDEDDDERGDPDGDGARPMVEAPGAGAGEEARWRGKVRLFGGVSWPHRAGCGSGGGRGPVVSRLSRSGWGLPALRVPGLDRALPESGPSLHHANHCCAQSHNLGWPRPMPHRTESRRARRSPTFNAGTLGGRVIQLGNGTPAVVNAGPASWFDAGIRPLPGGPWDGASPHPRHAGPPA